MSKLGTIAILAASTGLGQAMQQTLAATYGNREFKIIQKIADAPAGATLASLGMPTYIPGAKGVNVIVFGTKGSKDDTKEQKTAQWEKIRNPESTCEQIAPELGNVQEYFVSPASAMSEAKLAKADARLELMDAKEAFRETDDKDAYIVALEAAIKTLTA